MNRIVDPELIKKYWENHPCCEICGSKKTDSPHHITYKSHGGNDLPAELITLCNGFSMNQHHLTAHFLKKPYLIGKKLYEIKGVCETYPDDKLYICPYRKGKPNTHSHLCKWFGECKFTYEEQFKKDFKKLKEIMKNAKRSL